MPGKAVAVQARPPSAIINKKPGKGETRKKFFGLGLAVGAGILGKSSFVRFFPKNRFGLEENPFCARGGVYNRKLRGC